MEIKVTIQCREGTSRSAERDDGREFASIAEYDTYIQKIATAEGAYCMKVFLKLNAEGETYGLKHEVLRNEPMGLDERVRRYCAGVVDGTWNVPRAPGLLHDRDETERQRCLNWLTRLDAHKAAAS